MASLNAIVKPPRRVTHEGAPAKRITDVQELRRTLMACLLWEGTFYESGESVADRLAAMAVGVPWQDVKTLAIEARTVAGLRHAPMWLLVQALKRPHHDRLGWADAFVECAQRPDDVAEALALYWKDGKRPIAAAFKRGIARAMRKFSAYQLAKYNRDGAVKLRDLLFLSHATPKDDAQAATWKALVGDTLPPPDTWEVALSAGADKRATWERLLDEQKLGALALVRNLRNMVAAGVDREKVRAALAGMSTDLVWPYHFIAAERHAPEFSAEIESAMLRALANAPRLAGRTVLLVDASGSMANHLSVRSELSRLDAAAGLAILLREVCEDVRIAAFNHTVRVVPARRGFGLRDAIGAAGGGTNTEDAKRWADAQGYDRLIIMTDEQSRQSLGNPQAKGYVINVASYRNGIGYGAWTHIDGWSEHAVRYIAWVEHAA